MLKAYNQNRTVLSPKGQKIIAALFLVTSHLPENDPLREKLRALGVGIVDCPEGELGNHCGMIGGILQAAQYAGLISEKNATIIDTELKYFADPMYRNDTLISTLFPTTPTIPFSSKGHISDKKTHTQDMSFTTKQTVTNAESRVIHSDVQKEKKDKRHEKILSYITERKSASVKDVAGLFPEVSEKTIQRELGVLVETGKIGKQGDKRWSIYVALGA